MSKRKVQVIKPYSFRDNFIDKLSIKDRAYLDLLMEGIENAELEGEPDRPVDVLPDLPSFIGRVCSGYAPVWGELQTPLV
jgi:hypothetical protein